MPDEFKVIITDVALSDLQSIADFIRQDSPQNAESMATELLNAIDSLATFPDRFRAVGRSRKRRSRVHAMVVYPFIVYYHIDVHLPAVFVLTVLHGARRQPRRLK